jgi:hypothetical protein
MLSSGLPESSGEPWSDRTGRGGSTDPATTSLGELSTGVGRSHGTSKNVSFDGWFRYSAGFASDTATQLFTRAGLAPGENR